MNKFYITTPIYYANAAPHIGSTYTTVAADVLARFHRLKGDKTFFLTGTDEHGAKIAQYAEKAGQEPQTFVDAQAEKFQKAWESFNVQNDKFIRTTDADHKQASQKVLEALRAKGYIYKGEYKGLYCVGCEQYKTEKELVDGLCPDHKTRPEEMREECYMFKLSAFTDKIREKIESDELQILPRERKNEILGLLKAEGLRDIAASRKNVKWGIELPWDREHTTYVWMEAFLNYLTGLGWDGEPNNLLPLTKGEVQEGVDSDKLNFWPADIHLMAKDILRVHATIWPAILLALDIPLPKTIFVHGYFLVDGQKMSKSLGNVITPRELIDRYGVDASRYLLMSATTFGRDGDIGWGRFDEKYTADLANGIGNLVARSITLFDKTQNAKLKAQNHNAKVKTLFDIDEDLISVSWKKYIEEFNEKYRPDGSLAVINRLITSIDELITKTAPWKMIKEGDETVGPVMYYILENIRHISLMLWPFMPQTSEEIWRRLGLDPEEVKKTDFEELIQWGGLDPETKVVKGEPLFPRLKTDI